MKIFRTYRIHAARYIPTLNDIHPCKKMHGHTFKIIIELDGPINNDGFVMDFYDLDKIVKDKVISKIDHKVLNDISGLKNPSSEHLAVWVWEQLIIELDYLHQVTISEDHGTGIKYLGN